MFWSRSVARHLQGLMALVVMAQTQEAPLEDPEVVTREEAPKVEAASKELRGQDMKGEVVLEEAGVVGVDLPRGEGGVLGAPHKWISLHAGVS